MQLPGNKVELIESYGGTLTSFQCALLIYRLNKKGIDGSHPCLGLAKTSGAWPITQAEQEKLDKAKRKQETEDAKIQKQLELEQRHDERERLKKEREKEKEKNAAEKQCQKAEKEATKSDQATQQLKRKAPQSVPPKNKR
ncbi:hypothetical protein EJ02DRAFT_432816 [Clathrospora elynae]|uniref:Uncharacterized protein n=1 Tax=Clathrospora elynae TaxID=706981 RepID=A0A6A5SXI2_9PLEO|nr:hypothetical protein EJ02DRAFT_432816 [Clathrospora elynae]